jgi:excisionase family DNA binding protein
MVTTASAPHIRSLLVEPKEQYTVVEAAEVLVMDRQAVLDWIASGELEALETRGETRLEWSELLSFAMTFWDHEEVERELGADVARVLPDLLRLDDLHLRLPRLEIAAIERLAESEKQSVNAFVARELLDLLSANSGWLSDVIPGFGEAFAWPLARA